MKLVKKVVCAVLFMSALSVSAYAGDMETPGYAPPPPDRSICQAASTDATTNSCLTPETTENTTETSDELVYYAIRALMSFF
jgi:hypothetical protein